jgi:transposase
MIAKIENIVCIGEGVDPSEIHCRDRRFEVREVRQIIMYFAKEMTGKTWSEIGGYFDLDHATAMYSHRVVQQQREVDRSFREKLKRHERRLKAVKIDKMVIKAGETFKPLELEVMKLEKKITELKEIIEMIRLELTYLNIENENNR